MARQELDIVDDRTEQLARRQTIVRLEEHLEARPDALTAADFVTRHHFADGSYGREIELPEGSVVVGKIHRHSHVNVVSRGRALCATEDGVVEISAPATFVSKPGTKRVVLALEATTWTTVHVTAETDLEAIERDVIAPTFEDLRQIKSAIGELKAIAAAEEGRA